VLVYDFLLFTIKKINQLDDFRSHSEMKSFSKVSFEY